jgi:hypothetical protein
MIHHEKLHTEISELRKKQIFFIGGAIKSGTTWLQLLLDAHPEVSCRGEGHFFDNLAPALKMALDQHCGVIVDKNETLFNEIDGYPLLADDDFTYMLGACIALFLMRQSKDKPAQAIGEKTPDNSRYFAELSVVFPAAKFIHLVRDGRDCAVSGWFHNLRLASADILGKFGSVGEYAKAFAEVWASELATAQKFIDRNPHRVHQIRYEDIVASPKQALAGVCTFLGVEATKTIVDRSELEASFEKLSGGRKPGNEDRLSFFRKGVSGDWRNHLDQTHDAAFRETAGTWMRRFGYA